MATERTLKMTYFLSYYLNLLGHLIVNLVQIMHGRSSIKIPHCLSAAFQNL